MEKKTPLYESHVALGAKMVEFGGFLMPVQYPTGILAEHMAVREKAGLFDVSHMGELVFHGEDALENIQHLVTTDISKMLDGDMRYGMFCNDEGGVVDDLIVYRMAQDDYLIVVNAGNRDKDAAWVEAHLSGHPGYHDAGNEFGQIAVQGPVSKEILLKLCDEAALPAKYYSFTKASLTWNGRSAETYVSRSGYTGSFGYEILCKAEDTVWLWNTLLEAGKEFGLIPCGLGARDTLRLEAAMPLYGHELTDDITPRWQGFPASSTARISSVMTRWSSAARRRSSVWVSRASDAVSCASIATSTPHRTARRSAGPPLARSRRISAAASRWVMCRSKTPRSVSMSMPTCAVARSRWRSFRPRSISAELVNSEDLDVFC